MKWVSTHCKWPWRLQKHCAGREFRAEAVAAAKAAAAARRPRSRYPLRSAWRRRQRSAKAEPVQSAQPLPPPPPPHVQGPRGEGAGAGGCRCRRLAPLRPGRRLATARAPRARAALHRRRRGGGGVAAGGGAAGAGARAVRRRRDGAGGRGVSRRALRRPGRTAPRVAGRGVGGAGRVPRLPVGAASAPVPTRARARARARRSRRPPRRAKTARGPPAGRLGRGVPPAATQAPPGAALAGAVLRPGALAAQDGRRRGRGRALAAGARAPPPPRTRGASGALGPRVGGRRAAACAGRQVAPLAGGVRGRRLPALRVGVGVRGDGGRGQRPAPHCGLRRAPRPALDRRRLHHRGAGRDGGRAALGPAAPLRRRRRAAPLLPASARAALRLRRGARRRGAGPRGRGGGARAALRTRRPRALPRARPRTRAQPHLRARPAARPRPPAARRRARRRQRAPGAAPVARAVAASGDQGAQDWTTGVLAIASTCKGRCPLHWISDLFHDAAALDLRNPNICRS